MSFTKAGTCGLCFTRSLGLGTRTRDRQSDGFDRTCRRLTWARVRYDVALSPLTGARIGNILGTVQATAQSTTPPGLVWLSWMDASATPFSTTIFHAQCDPQI